MERRKDQQFKLKSNFKPAGDQPEAISALTNGLERGDDKQTLLGVTGSGKTYTMANIIQNVQKPTLIMAHNKTLAAQLAQEFREFFPDNAVHYFVSYYDYYQPEAYIPNTDTYIEKDASINEEIDRLRHASTQALLTRNDTIIVASVSCIYGLGAPAEYERRNLRVTVGDEVGRTEFIRKLINVYYERTNADLSPGEFRAIGNAVEVMPVSEKRMLRIEFVGSSVDHITAVDPVSSTIEEEPETVFIFPAQHFVTGEDERERAIAAIEHELSEQLKKFEEDGKWLEAERIKRRTRYDIAMIREIGYTNGIENYSRHLSGREPGEAPDTLLSYFPHDENGNPEFLTFIDESHVTLPQIAGMYGGDRARKETLVRHGFRLPSALDNRPLMFDEFEDRVGQEISVSATPAKYEYDNSTQVAEQIIRPTGLIDPHVEIRPITPSDQKDSDEGEQKQSSSDEHESDGGQVQDFINEAEKEIANGGRVLATTLTKKMAEDLSVYLKERNINAEYLHSEVKTIDRVRTITSFRKGDFDCLVGVNLLREGLDMPEVSFIGILDADKEGFLRSETSLIQTIGRAARNVDGRVILYADRETKAMKSAIEETERRREKQLAYNKKHNITPETIQKEIHDISEQLDSEHDKTVNRELKTELSALEGKNKKQQQKGIKDLISKKEEEMQNAVKVLDFETAAILRDEIAELQKRVEEK